MCPLPPLSSTGHIHGDSCRTCHSPPLVSRFAIAANLKDYEAFTATWATDGVWRIMPPIDVTIQGCHTINEGICGLLGKWEWFVQIPHEGVITLKDEDHATGRWIISERAKPAHGEGGHFNHGIYLDHYVRENGQWKCARRGYNYRYLDESAHRTGHHSLQRGARALACFLKLTFMLVGYYLIDLFCAGAGVARTWFCSVLE